MTGPSRRGGNLNRASRVSGRDQIRIEIGNMTGLSRSELGGCFRLNQIVDARAAAAHVGFRGAHHFQSRNGTEQVSRFTPDALGVREVAGVVIDHLAA